MTKKIKKNNFSFFFFFFFFFFPLSLFLVSPPKGLLVRQSTTRHAKSQKRHGRTRGRERRKHTESVQEKKNDEKKKGFFLFSLSLPLAQPAHGARACVCSVGCRVTAGGVAKETWEKKSPSLGFFDSICWVVRFQSSIVKMNQLHQVNRAGCSAGRVQVQRSEKRLSIAG
jgi:hypothetical protein